MFSHFLRKLGLFTAAKAKGRTLRLGERKWRLAPNAVTVFGPAGPDLDRWIASGAAEIVKSGPHRTVYRMALPAGTVYVKHCRVSGVRSWCRELLRPAKARLEFENLLALHDRGIDAVVPLAWGAADSGRPGESFLITESREGAIPFLAYADSPPSPQARIHLARALGQFFAKLHDVGVAHPDPHPGNLLVELSAARVPRFSLIDLHAVRLTRPLSWPESRANLILFNRWFQLRASRADRLRFWHAYRRSRTALPTASASQFAKQAREVERGTAASNLRFWQSRASRCLGVNRYFRQVKAGSIRGHAVADLPERVLNLLAKPDSLFEQHDSRILKDSRTSTVAEIVLPYPGGSRRLILKRVNVRHWFELVKNVLRPSAVLRSWWNGHTLRDRWLPTPRPLAALHRYRFGLPAEGYLLTEKVADPRQLRAAPPHAIGQLARMLRAMHDRAVSHRDLKASNLLLEMGYSPMLIDLVGVRAGESVSFARRARELARLNASFLTCHAVTSTVRLRFLSAYLSAGERPSRDWKEWWSAISGATQAKIAKNQRSGRPLG
jgi:tRNA A-37 threonylcarbamoyl transferase component Bud32